MRRRVFYSEDTEKYPGIIARNNAVLQYERFVHRTFYPHIVHPYSSFRVNWEVAFIGLIPIRLIAVSIFWLSMSHQAVLYQMFVLSFQLLNLMDVVSKFFTGYVERDTEMAVLEPRKIAKRYLLTVFIFDFIPCLPVEMAVFIFNRVWLAQQERRQYIVKHVIIDSFTLSMILRLVSLYQYCRNQAKLKIWNEFLLGMCCILIYLCNLFLFATEINAVILKLNSSDPFNASLFDNKLDEPTLFPVIHLWDSDIEGKLFNFANALLDLILDSIYFHSIYPLISNFIRALIVVSGFFSGIIFMAYFIKYATTKMQTKEQFLNIESRINTFVRKRHLSLTLGAKTLLYFKFLFENNSLREDEIFNYIPDTYKADIFFHLCLPLLKNFYAFEDLPMYVLRRLAECMKYQLHLPNEVVMKRDEPCFNIFFVQRGTVALYSSNHTELYHFEAGSSFNGKNLILADSFTNTYAISIEVSEVYRLEQADFYEVMAAYPKMMKAIQEKIRKDKAGNVVD